MKITYGDIFSGMSCPAFALKQSNIEFEYKFACDINKESINFLKNEHSPEIIYKDVRDITELPHVNLMVAGFPCQPFSSANTKIKTQNHKSVDLFLDVIRCIGYSKPDVFILENVKGLTFKSNKLYFNRCIEKLDGLDEYRYEYKILNSKDYGQPQSRSRIWFIGVKKNKEIIWPKPKDLNIKAKDLVDHKLEIKPWICIGKNRSVIEDYIKKDGLYIDNGQCTGMFCKLYYLDTQDFFYCVLAQNKTCIYQKIDGVVCKRPLVNEELYQIFGLKTKLNGTYNMAKLLGNGMCINMLENLITVNFELQ